MEKGTKIIQVIEGGISMISIKTNESENIIEVEVNEKITARDIEEFENYFNQKKENHDQINLLMVVNEMGYSLQGLVKDFKFDTNHWKEFNKVAVLSDKKWIELGAKMVEYLPKVEIEHFNPDEKDKAINWLH